MPAGQIVTTTVTTTVTETISTVITTPTTVISVSTQIITTKTSDISSKTTLEEFSQAGDLIFPIATLAGIVVITGAIIFMRKSKS